MFDSILKKIVIGIAIPIFVAVVGWSVWTTNQVFSAQQTKISFQEYIISHNKQYDEVRELINTVQLAVKDGFQKQQEDTQELNNKLDQSIQYNSQIFLDLQRQIGELNK